jgi:hypothetical protein
VFGLINSPCIISICVVNQVPLEQVGKLKLQCVNKKMTLNGVWIVEKVVTIEELCSRIQTSIQSFNNKRAPAYNASFSHGIESKTAATLTLFINPLKSLATKLTIPQLNAYGIDTTKYFVVEIQLCLFNFVYSVPLNESNTKILVFQSGNISKGELNVNNKSFTILSQIVAGHVATGFYNKYFPDVIQSGVCIVY